ncbi:MAG TPA: di-heme oxidoredictase family protein [Phycisphaerae bacterium]|nr:di-heme oxidoredictase family protein [Phycisphaerae bacterium]
MKRRFLKFRFQLLSVFLLTAAILPGCMGSCFPFFPGEGDGPIAPGVTGKLGDPMPSLTPEQLETFARGKEVLNKRFNLSDGLGPAFNVTSCGACHEKPVAGGSAALYRNFFIGAQIKPDGTFAFSESQGMAGGVLRVFNHNPSLPARPPVPDTTTIFAQRNAIPMFGVGLMAEITDEEILSRADPDDANGDGISGRPNHDRGFVGRFGLKCQTVSIEAFIRGPLFNHLGVTTNPLSNERRAQLPVDSSGRQKLIDAHRAAPTSDPKFGPHDQAAAADGPNSDMDGVPDPEMTEQELFDLVSFSMMLAAPEFEPLTFQTNHGRELFHAIGCALCHVPRLEGPRGPVPIFSDLLIHDMGPELADGIVMKEASGSEFRTQPLWGISAEGPFLHDGRAATINDAILHHGGEAKPARDAFDALPQQDKTDILEFLLSLGGRSQTSPGLLPPDEPIPDVAQYGGPFRALTAEELERYRRGRAVFDRDFSFVEGAGGLAGPDSVGRFNGDSCRACHVDPVIGGAGPRDVNVMRHGKLDMGGNFSPPSSTPNTILHKEIRLGHPIIEATSDINCFEMRQTPHNFGLGLIDAITEDTIRSHEDPTDTNSDGISGRAHILPNDGRLGRFGWKADVPSIVEFVRDAMMAEIGVTIGAQPNLTFGRTDDTDGVPDPELPLQDAEDLAFFMTMMAGPPRQPFANPAQVAAGEAVFASVGCTKCHIPSLPSALGDVPLFSDLLLHDILPGGTPGIVSGNATQTEFRTAPLWGLSQTAPYFHNGAADSIDQAIRLHNGEAAAIRQAYDALPAEDKAALLAFLDTL